MARNKMEDLRNHLFAALERLNEDDLNPEQLEAELRKTKAIRNLSGAIVETAKVEIEFIKAIGASNTNSELFKSVNQQKQLV